MRRKASSRRSTSSVSPTPSIELGRRDPGRERSTFSIWSIRSSSGAKRRRSRITLAVAPAATARIASTTTSPAESPATAPATIATAPSSTVLTTTTWVKRARLRTLQA
jgi:hypothetical protein